MPKRILQRTHSSGSVVLPPQASTSPHLYGKTPPLGLILLCARARAAAGSGSTGAAGPKQRGGGSSSIRQNRECADPSECDRSHLSDCCHATAHAGCSSQHRLSSRLCLLAHPTTLIVTVREHAHAARGLPRVRPRPSRARTRARTEICLASRSSGAKSKAALDLLSC